MRESIRDRVDKLTHSGEHEGENYTHAKIEQPSPSNIGCGLTGETGGRCPLKVANDTERAGNKTDDVSIL